ncbi:MAG TPA: hypothetical protein VMB46_01850 [Methanomassiliicoccales archaeon]|nr:hypothetical protein [Methanomassiliicoccales archaeon]
MESGIKDLGGRGKSHRVDRRLCEFAIAGGAAFWVANFAVSLTPIAVEYRAALSISYLPMILESLVGGLVIGFFVSYLLLRFYDRIPARSPILASIALSFIALLMVTILLQVPASLLTPSDSLRYFLIGTSFNVLRVLALGIVIGYLHRRLNKGSGTDIIERGPG